MIGVIEAFTDTGAALSDITKNPATLFRQHLSRNTELVLEVASRMTFPRSKEFFPETFRQISNLIYYANNYFDLGLTARQQLFQNKPFEFVALMTVFGETKINMDKAANELMASTTNCQGLIKNFIADGEILAASKKLLSGVEYREIDSGIAAVLTFGITGDKDCLTKIGVDLVKKCGNKEELMEKYKLFMVSKIDTKNLDDETKKVVGLQAVEMVLACLDDQWGIAEDSLLRIPNTWEGGDESNKFLINQYKKIAINCGFSKLIVELLTLFSRVHQLKTKMMLPGDAIELNDLEKYQNFGERYCLREWLNNHSILGEMLR